MDDDVIKIPIYKVVLDIILINAVGWTVFFIDMWATPYHRGVFCNDQSLAYPYKKGSTLDFRMVISIGYLLPLFTMLLIEFLNRSKNTKSYSCIGLKIPTWFVNFYSVYGIFCFGEAMTQVATDSTKYLVGRLRPYFMEACAPDVCEGDFDAGAYYKNFTCTRTKYKHGWRTYDMRLSFPSGHSSVAMYCMVYYAIYIHFRMTWSGSKLLKHVIEFAAVWAAIATGLTRISDYKHHWSDVFAGLTIGGTIAVISARVFSNLFVEEE